MLISLAIAIALMPVRPHAQAPVMDPIVAVGVVDAPAPEVWKAWTTSAGAASWMVAHAEIELKVGGKMRTHYSNEGKLGDPGTIENVIICFDPERMLSIKTVKTPARFPFKKAIQDMWTVIYLEPIDGGAKTKVTCRGLGFTADAESQQMRKFFERGNQITLDALVAKYRGKP